MPAVQPDPGQLGATVTASSAPNAQAPRGQLMIDKMLAWPGAAAVKVRSGRLHLVAHGSFASKVGANRSLLPTQFNMRGSTSTFNRWPTCSFTGVGV
jgi:hypothetical protein